MKRAKSKRKQEIKKKRQSSNERKERNKIAAAKSRANRREYIDAIDKANAALRVENEALRAERDALKFDVLSRALITPEPYAFAITESRLWMEQIMGPGGISL